MLEFYGGVINRNLSKAENNRLNLHTQRCITGDRPRQISNLQPEDITFYKFQHIFNR